MIHNFLPYITKHRQRRLEYFENAKEEIALQNLTLLRMISAVTTALILFFILITPLVIPSWHATAEYIAFFLCSLLITIYSISIYHRNITSPKLAFFSCYGFNVFLIGFMIIVDIFPFPDAGCVFTPMFLAISPTLFIFPYSVSHPSLLASEIIFVLLSLKFKPESVASIDIFHSIVGIVFGFALSYIITAIRINEYHVKNNYRNLSQIDGLTQLLNKSTTETAIRNYINTKNPNEVCTFIILDLDNFKTINDTLGHDAGDRVLYQISNILTTIFRSNDIIGRFGGDEFVIFMKNMRDNGEIKKKANQLIQAVRQLPVGIHGFSVTCSMGIVKTDCISITYDTLFHLADDALYEAKSYGKACFVLHTPSTSA